MFSGSDYIYVCTNDDDGSEKYIVMIDRKNSDVHVCDEERGYECRPDYDLEKYVRSMEEKQIEQPSSYCEERNSRD